MSLPTFTVSLGSRQLFSGELSALDDARGNLTLAFVELAHELVPRGLRNVVWENVPGVLSTHDNAFGCFLAGLVGASGPFVPTLTKPLPGKSNRWWGWSAKERNHYIKWPRYGVVTGPKGRAGWTVKDAQYYGLAQRRERVLVVADFGNGADPAAVLFEPESLPRHSPPSRETGQGTTHATAPSPTGGGGLGTDFDLDGGLIHAIQAGALRTNPNSGPDGVGVQADIAYTLDARAEVQAVSYAPEIARCDTTREGSSQDYESTTMVAIGVTGQISHALKAEGADASEDGTGRGTPIICFSAKDYGADATDNLAPTLRAGGHSTSHANAGVMPAVAYSVALRGREDGATAELGSDVAFALRAAGGGGDKPHVLVKGDGCLTPWDSQQKRVYDANAEVSPALSGVDSAGGRSPPAVAFTSAVRRLTPRECERLMGFPDDYTLIPWRGKPPALCPDGPRYKALGNSWAVPKFRWLGERIARLMPRR